MQMIMLPTLLPLARQTFLVPDLSLTTVRPLGKALLSSSALKHNLVMDWRKYNFHHCLELRPEDIATIKHFDGIDNSSTLLI